MAGESSFIKVLDKAELAKRSLEAQMAYVRRFYQDANLQAAYDAALQMEEISERLVLLARRLPAYTGSPMAGSPCAPRRCFRKRPPARRIMSALFYTLPCGGSSRRSRRSGIGTVFWFTGMSIAGTGRSAGTGTMTILKSTWYRIS